MIPQRGTQAVADRASLPATAPVHRNPSAVPTMPASQPRPTPAPSPAVTHPPASPAPALAMDTTDPQAIWQKLLADTQNKPAFGWIKSLRLDRLQGSIAQLSIQPGHRDMARFFGERQRTQLSQMLSAIVGKPIKADLQTPAGQLAEGDDEPLPAAGGPVPGGRTAITAAQRQEIMSLPLVRELMETFDLSLVEVRRQKPIAPAGQNNSQEQSAGADEPSLDDLPPPPVDEFEEMSDDV